MKIKNLTKATLVLGLLFFMAFNANASSGCKDSLLGESELAHFYSQSFTSHSQINKISQAFKYSKRLLKSKVAVKIQDAFLGSDIKQHEGYKSISIIEDNDWFHIQLQIEIYDSGEMRVTSSDYYKYEEFYGLKMRVPYGRRAKGINKVSAQVLVSVFNEIMNIAKINKAVSEIVFIGKELNYTEARPLKDMLVEWGFAPHTTESSLALDDVSYLYLNFKKPK